MTDLEREVAMIFARSNLGSICPAIGDDDDVAVNEYEMIAARAAIAAVVERCAEMAERDCTFFNGSTYISIRIAQSIRALAASEEVGS